MTYYNLQNRNSSLCLSSYQTYSIQYACSLSSRSLFELSPSDDGHYRLIVEYSRKCLTIENVSLSNKADIVEATCSSNLAQQWALVPVGDGYYSLRNRNSGKCMDVQDDSRYSYALIWQYTCDYDLNQQFRFV